jgi:hypothetical protein
MSKIAPKENDQLLDSIPNQLQDTLYLLSLRRGKMSRNYQQEKETSPQLVSGLLTFSMLMCRCALENMFPLTLLEVYIM